MSLLFDGPTEDKSFESRDRKLSKYSILFLLAFTTCRFVAIEATVICDHSVSTKELASRPNNGSSHRSSDSAGTH